MMKHSSLTISVELVNFIMNLTSQFGADTQAICAEAGINSAILEVTSGRLPYDQFIKIWNVLEHKSTDKELGLHLGENGFSFPGHILSVLILNAPTIKDAIEKFCQYFNLLNDINTPVFSIDGNLASLSIRFHTKEFKSSRHIFESLLAAYASVLRRISNNEIHFDSVCFIHQAPEDISEHQRIFAAPLFFEQMENKLVFNSQYLDQPLQFSNNEMLETLERLAQKLQKRLYTYGPWSDKVSNIMMNMLKGEKREIEYIASHLAISPRNLQKKLKYEGVTYQKLLENVRKEQALYFLEQTNVTISEIALLLGYSEQSVFSRAFKIWTGSTPGQFRTGTK